MEDEGKGRERIKEERTEGRYDKGRLEERREGMVNAEKARVEAAVRTLPVC